MRHSVDGVAALKRRESNHGKTEKGRCVLGLNWRLLIWPNHGGLEAISWWFGTESWYFQIMVLSRFEGPETASATGQAHPHSQPQDSENPKD